MVNQLSALLFLAIAPAAYSGWQVTWNTVDGATSYPIYCEATPTGTGPFTAIGAPVAPPFDVSAAKPMVANTQYECWVRAAASGVESSDSNHLVVTEPGPVQTITLPGAPTTIQLEYN